MPTIILIFIAVVVVIVILAVSTSEGKSVNQYQQEYDEQLLKKAALQLQMFELRKQAQLVGDTKTVESIDDLSYKGKLPEKRNDGAYMSMYDNLRILKIAGMNYRGNLSSYVGEFRGILKAEPTNEYDPMAIRVQVEDGKHVGYIREEQTGLVRSMIGEGEDFKPYRITGVIYECNDEGRRFFDGFVYIVKKK